MHRGAVHATVRFTARGPAMAGSGSRDGGAPSHLYVMPHHMMACPCALWLAQLTSASSDATWFIGASIEWWPDNETMLMASSGGQTSINRCAPCPGPIPTLSSAPMSALHRICFARSIQSRGYVDGGSRERLKRCSWRRVVATAALLVLSPSQ